MYKYIVLAFLATSSLYAMEKDELPKLNYAAEPKAGPIDLKIVNNAEYPLHVNLKTYRGIRRYRSNPQAALGDTILCLICPPLALLTYLQNEVIGENMRFIIEPGHSLIICDLLPEEKVKAYKDRGLAGLWYSLPLAEARALVRKNERERFVAHAKARKEEVDKAGGIAYASGYIPLRPIRNLAIISVTPNTGLFFTHGIAHRMEEVAPPLTTSADVTEEGFEVIKEEKAYLS